MNEALWASAYLASALLFVLGLKAFNAPQTARRGILLAEIGMLLAVVGTLLRGEIIQYQWILLGLVLGSTIGALMAILMPMTAMPQRIAISHSFGALAATLVGVVEYYERGPTLAPGTMAALGFEVLFGSLTITGSLVAFGKLQALVKSAPILYRFQQLCNALLFGATLVACVWLVVRPATGVLFYGMAASGLLLGVLIVLPIGGADMPVVLALLNSYAGLAAAATGLVISNPVLLIAGALDGTSGFVLSLMMSRAMNRSFASVLFGAVGATRAETGGQQERTVMRYTPQDAAYILEHASSVIIIPGYGLAVAQAQYAVQELAALLMARGATVRYAIHPVAGRMPGHMNVLLAEAHVPYDLLYEPERINDDFQSTDVALVVGANDVVNPAARSRKESPLYGMPILNADQAHSVLVLKRSLAAGFAGEDNDLFYEQKTMMIFGDAKATLTSILHSVKQTAPELSGSQRSG